MQQLSYCVLGGATVSVFASIAMTGINPAIRIIIAEVSNTLFATTFVEPTIPTFWLYVAVGSPPKNAQIVGGIVAVFVGIFIKQIRKFFPPLITGTVVVAEKSPIA